MTLLFLISSDGSSLLSWSTTEMLWRYTCSCSSQVGNHLEAKAIMSGSAMPKSIITNNLANDRNVESKGAKHSWAVLFVVAAISLAIWEIERQLSSFLVLAGGRGRIELLRELSMWSTSAKSSSSDGRESAQDVDVVGLCGGEAELLAADCLGLDCTSRGDVGLLGVTLSCEM